MKLVVNGINLCELSRVTQSLSLCAGGMVKGCRPDNEEAGYDVLRRMQKATISSSLNIVRTFKATVN